MRLPLSIIATGKALPTQRILSSDLDVKLGLPTGFVAKKSGLQWRYFADDNTSQSQLGAQALLNACTEHSISRQSIDLLICASAIPEQVLPNTAGKIIALCDLKAGVAGFDINSSCISFISALFQAAALLQTGAYKRIAIVASEIASRGLNWQDNESSLIFGDGAAAVIVEVGSGQSVCVANRLEVHPQGRHLCEIRAGGTARNPRMGLNDDDHYFRMQGKAVFKMASKLLPPFLEQLFAPLDYKACDVDVIVPHQASHLAMQHAKTRLGFRSEQVIDIYATHGNQVAASLPTALHEAHVTGRLQQGSRLLIMGTAAGFALGAMVLEL